jgi:hypothetical protein
MKIVAMIQVYNEVENGNLERCLSSIEKYCDAIQVYDDGSTDEPWDLYCKYNCNVILSDKNDFQNELGHKQMQLDRCKDMGANWIWRIDADEVLEYIGGLVFREFVKEIGKNFDSATFHMTNLWRDESFYRKDNAFNDVVFNRLWKVPREGLRFDVKRGLHQTNYPIGMTDNEFFAPYEILHYGFASDQAIIDKYNMYKSHGQTGWALNRLVDETALRVAKSKDKWFASPIDRPSRNEVFAKPIISMV